jgi:hypothetical protein
MSTGGVGVAVGDKVGITVGDLVGDARDKPAGVTAGRSIYLTITAGVAVVIGVSDIGSLGGLVNS